jgi:methylthioribulose-1-phosphate dehydratase
MICDLDGVAVDESCRPSAETPLHCRLYELGSSVGAVLHTHSVASTLVSKNAGGVVCLAGFEMQKAIAGVTTHEAELAVKVFPNDQDMHALADRVSDAWHAGELAASGFLVAGHGLYAWGRTLDEAVRHTEGLEFLLECAWHELLAGLR